MSNQHAPPRLVVTGLQSAYGGPFDLSIAEGECVGVLGRSGSGKSVLLRLIADLDPGEGRVYLDGKSRDTFTAPEWRRRVVYQAAEPAWWAPTAGAHFPVSAEARPVSQWMAALDLAPELLGVDISRLSTGERQRLALLRSLARAPSVLMLDEPTSSLDHASALAVERLLQAEMKSGMAMLLVSHSREQARRMTRRCYDMENGRLQPS